MYYEGMSKMLAVLMFHNNESSFIVSALSMPKKTLFYRGKNAHMLYLIERVAYPSAWTISGTGLELGFIPLFPSGAYLSGLAP